MATEKTTERTDGRGADGRRNAIVGVMTTAQGAAQATAEVVRNAAGTAADAWPSAMSTAQDVSGRTARTLEGMPDQALVIGTSFSLGLGIGLFLSGANRLLVILALGPAAAMAITLLGRDPGRSRATARGRSAGVNAAGANAAGADTAR